MSLPDSFIANARIFLDKDSVSDLILLRVKCLIFIVLSWTGSLAAQERTAMAELLHLFGETGTPEIVQPGKCGTAIVFEAQRRMNDLPPGLQQSTLHALQRPVLQKSRLSASGRFRIHYDTTGIHQPAILAGSPALRVADSFEQYVDSVAAIMDHCWNVEVDGLGYDAPPQDGSAGGGPEYDVYLQNLPGGVFGYTSWGNGEIQFESGTRERSTTHIVMDNDYLGYRTQGWDGLRVTAAHEFHHAIQVGAYGIWNTVPNSDFYFYELTAVWMEDVVYDGINDYLFDLPAFFAGYRDVMNRSYSFTEFNVSLRAGYERSVFAHYLEQRFGGETMREIWQGVRDLPVLRSINRVLRERGSSLADAFAEFSFWNLFTGSRADTVRYYPEGRLYPTLAANASVQFSGMTSAIRSSAFPFSSQYYRFNSLPDTVLAVVVHKNFEHAYDSPGSSRSVEVVLSNGTPPGGVQTLQNGYKSGFLVQDPEDWRTFYVGTSALNDLRTRSLAFPNPLNLSHTEFLVLPADGSFGGNAELILLTSSLDLVFSGTYPVVDNLGKAEVRIPVAHLAGRVSTGIHFVILKTSQKEYQWKIAVVR